MGADPDEPLADEADPIATPSTAHVHSAWRSWLSALATDAEAALAAALAYESLPAEARDAWLDAVDADGPQLNVPALALYAPLLAVESEPSRRHRIEAMVTAGLEAEHEHRQTHAQTRALCGVGADGTHACLIVSALYLDFVQIIACKYTPAGGFLAVRHDPLRHVDDVSSVCEVDGVSVEPTPLRVVIDELAHAILADRRKQRSVPDALASFAHLFGPDFDDADDKVAP